MFCHFPHRAEATAVAESRWSFSKSPELRYIPLLVRPQLCVARKMYFSHKAVNVITRVLHKFQMKVKWVLL